MEAPDYRVELIFVCIDELCLVIDGVCDVNHLD